MSKLIADTGIGIINFVAERQYIVVPETANRSRLEDFLFRHFGGLSRMYLRRVVKEGGCEVNGRLENVGYRLRRDDLVEIDVDLSRENSMRPQDIPLEIIFEDAHLVVVNKPTGMLVHPTNIDKSGTLLNALSHHFNHRGDNLNGVIRPGLIHRLDKDTSGLMIIAKTDRAHKSLSRQFQLKYVEKRYVALVAGLVDDDHGIISTSIGRFADQKRWDVKVDGKPAETRFWVIDRFADSTLLELEPVTGRTNQLRIHTASIGHPILGDVSRGGSEFGRLCLHAFKLAVRHPVTREDMTFTTRIPASFGVSISADGGS